jgi:hypothetical protein
VYAPECSAAKFNGGTWLLCVSTSVRVGSGERREGRWVAPPGGNCYSLPLHTLLWTVVANTRLGEEGGGPGELGVYAACRVCTFNGVSEAVTISVFGMLTK